MAAAFLLARVALGMFASAPPAHATQEGVTGPAVAGAHLGVPPGNGHPRHRCCPQDGADACCGAGLCGTALAVLPAGASWNPIGSGRLAFGPASSPSPRDTRPAPDTPPPRS